MSQFMGYGEAEAIQLPLRSLLHERVLLGIEVDTAEIRLDRRFHPILGDQVVERDGVQTEIHLEKGEYVDGRAIFFQKIKLRTQLVNFPPNVVHGSVGLLAVCGVQFLDVLGEARQFLLGEFVATGGTEEGGKRTLEDSMVSHISGNLAPLKGGLVHEGQLLGTGEAEEIRQPFQKPDVAGWRIHSAFDLTPIAWIETGLRAEVAQGETFLKTQVFDGVIEHGIPFVAVVERYHTRQAPALRKIFSRKGAETQRKKGFWIFFGSEKLCAFAALRESFLGSWLPPHAGEGGLDLLLEAGDQFAVGGDQRLLGFDLRDDGPLRGEGREGDGVCQNLPRSDVALRSTACGSLTEVVERSATKQMKDEALERGWLGSQDTDTLIEK